jgi:hypothetical protein
MNKKMADTEIKKSPALKSRGRGISVEKHCY